MRICRLAGAAAEQRRTVAASAVAIRPINHINHLSAETRLRVGALDYAANAAIVSQPTDVFVTARCGPMASFPRAKLRARPEIRSKLTRSPRQRLREARLAALTDRGEKLRAA